MLKIMALVPQSIIHSKIQAWVNLKCAEKGATVAWHNVTEDCTEYKNLFQEADNIITWNCRMPHSWLIKHNKNILFADNSLISQKSGIFVDSEGYFSNSSLRKNKTWLLNNSTNLSFIAERDFKWSAFSGGDIDGPILVALQLRTDCNVHFEYPLAKNKNDKILATLELLKEHLPRGRKILIRPHPREWAEFDLGGVWRDDWRLSSGGTFSNILPTCSALVSVNSTCVSEAALLNIPTATLGTGTFTGSHISLDCSEDPSLLGQIYSFQADKKACEKYCSAVLTRNFIPYDVAENRHVEEFEIWLNQLK